MLGYLYEILFYKYLVMDMGWVLVFEDGIFLIGFSLRVECCVDKKEVFFDFDL